MRKLLIIGSFAVLTAVSSSQAFADGPYGPYGPYLSDYRTNAPYWPAYRSYDWANQAGCVRWNWQQLSYYNYCGDPGSYVRPGRGGLRVRG